VAAGAPAAIDVQRQPARMSSYQVLDPDEPFFFDPTVPVIVRNLESAERRARAYSILRGALRDSDQITLVHPDGREATGQLIDLKDNSPLQEVRVTAVHPEAARRSIAGARAIVARLRGPGGCPWDREQTPESLIRFVIEEAYEVADAIRTGAPADLADELGDVLLQVLLQSEIASETDAFNFDDVLETLNDKLIRRHPHVFGDVVAGSAEQVLKNWDRIKQAEKTDKRKSELDGAGKGLPSLMAAQSVQRRARSVGFDWPPGGAWRKLEEELQELREASSPADVEHELGDLLFMVARIGIEHDVDAEVALAAAISRVRSRFGFLEAQLHDEGRSIRDADTSELESLWTEAKRLEHQTLKGHEKSDR
jgi:MazG family protein